MVTLKALRLAAIVVSYGNPRCNVLLLSNGGNMLEGSCWATCQGKEELLTERINPTVASVRAWLGY